MYKFRYKDEYYVKLIKELIRQLFPGYTILDDEEIASHV